MKTILAAMIATAGLAGGAAASAEGPATGAVAPPAHAANSVFADLAALGYDLGKFKPDHTGRYPYR